MLHCCNEVIKKEFSVSLLFAAQKGDLSKAKDALREGANINVQDPQGNTPLHLSVQAGHFSIVKTLLHEGANLAIKNNQGKVPQDLLPPMKNIYEKLENPLEKLLKETTKKRSQKLFNAAAVGDLATIKKYLFRGVPIHIKDSTNATLLHKSAAGGHIQASFFFSKKGLSLVQKDKKGHTPASYLSPQQRTQLLDELFFAPDTDTSPSQNLDKLIRLYAIFPQSDLEKKYAALYQKLTYKAALQDTTPYTSDLPVAFWAIKVNVLGNSNASIEKLYALKQNLESQPLDDTAFQAYLQVLLNLKRCTHRQKDRTADTIISYWLAGTGIILTQRLISLVKRFRYETLSYF